MNQSDFDEEFLAKAAKEALGWDGPIDLDGPENRTGQVINGKEFGVVFNYPPSEGDLRNESNFAATLAACKEAAGDNAERDVRVGRVSHWTWPFFDTIEIRVYEPGYEPNRWEHVDEHPQDVEDVRYTAAFLAAVECAERRKRYGLVDEEEFIEREHDAWQAAIDAGIASAQRSYDDGEHIQNQIVDVMWELEEEAWDGDRYAYISEDGSTREAVSEDRIREKYAAAREEWLARRDAGFWGDPVYLHRR